jgi:hypothetical protein
MKTQIAAPNVTGHETDLNDNEIYSVPSRSSSDIYLVVVDHAGHASCACKSALYRGKCAHISAVKLYEATLAAKVRDAAPMYRSNAPFSIWKS